LAQVTAHGYLNHSSSRTCSRIHVRTHTYLLVQTRGMAAPKARSTVCPVALFFYSIHTATSIKMQANRSSQEDGWQQPPPRMEFERTLACASYAGEYEVWYSGGRRGTNMVIGCDCRASQPGIFSDWLRFNGVSNQCPGLGSLFYILNTHGSGKYECLSVSGTTISGYHYTSWQAYWGTIQYRLISAASCDSGTSPWAADSTCNGGWVQGDGAGGSESYIGVAEDCRACIQLVFDNYPSAAAATYRTPGDGSSRVGQCYAEHGWSNSNGSPSWITIPFNTGSPTPVATPSPTPPPTPPPSPPPTPPTRRQTTR